MMQISLSSAGIRKCLIVFALLLCLLTAQIPVLSSQISAQAVSIPLRVGVILAERTPGASSQTELYRSLASLLNINRIPWDIYDIYGSGESLFLVDNKGNPKYSSLVIMMPGHLITEEISRSILEAAKMGTGIVAITPNVPNELLMPLFGIEVMGTNWIPSDGIHIEADEFTFAYAGHEIQQPALALMDHQVEKNATIIARDTRLGLPVIWTYKYGLSQTVFFNNNGLQSRYFQGILLQAILYSMPVGLASPVNAGVIQVNAHTRSYYSPEYLQNFYYDFGNNLAAFLDAYNLKSSMFITFSYSGNISDFWLYPESVEGVYRFLARGDEIGLNCGTIQIPLVAEYWGGETAIRDEVALMKLALDELAARLESDYGVELGEIVSYVAPMNEISIAGYQALDSVTDIKYVCTEYEFVLDGDVNPSGTYNTTYKNFGWEPGTGIYNLPRSQGDFFTFSGKADSDASYNAWSTLRSLIESGQPYLIFTHPDEYLLLNQVQYPGTGMEDIFAGATAWADYVSQNYPYYRWVTTAELGEIMVSRSGPLDARWLAGDNILEITGHSPSEALQIKTPLYLSSIREAGNRLEFSFSQTPVEIQTPGYDIVKTGQNYMIYPSGSSTYMPQTPDQDFVFAKTSPPAVETRPATQIDTSTATINGRLTSLGSAKSAEVYFEWGLTPEFGNVTPRQKLDAAGTFSVEITGLSAEQTCYYRAMVSAEGIALGDIHSVIIFAPATTAPVTPTPTTTQNPPATTTTSGTTTPITTSTIAPTTSDPDAMLKDTAEKYIWFILLTPVAVVTLALVLVLNTGKAKKYR
jgi:hypothetical protein